MKNDQDVENIKNDAVILARELYKILNINNTQKDVAITALAIVASFIIGQAKEENRKPLRDDFAELIRLFIEVGFFSESIKNKEKTK